MPDNDWQTDHDVIDTVMKWQQHRDLPEAVKNFIYGVNRLKEFVREDHVDMVIDAVTKLNAPRNIVGSLTASAGPETMHIVFDYLWECGIDPADVRQAQGDEAFGELAIITDMLEADGALSLYIKLEKISGSVNHTTLSFHQLLGLVRDHLAKIKARS